MNIPTIKELYGIAPKEIKEYIDKCKKTEQSVIWHPEGNVYNHISIVYNRAKKTGDIDLALAAFFHDLGKVDTTKPNKHGGLSAIGHENVSAKLVERYQKWVKDLGANPQRVYYIVKQHMRIKQYNNMRSNKKQALKDHKYFNDLLKFTDFDNMSTLTNNELNS